MHHPSFAEFLRQTINRSGLAGKCRRTEAIISKINSLEDGGWGKQAWPEFGLWD